MTVIHYISPASDKRIAPLISVVIPFYNEESVIQACHDRVVAALDNLRAHCEIIYIDDGSSDDSAKMVSELSSELHDISLIRLSRNFGKEAAMSAGIKATRGEAVVLLDADLQDPPELISDMVEQWQQGYDVVDMQRRERLGESAFKRYTAAIFYKVLNRLCDVPIPENVGDFRLLDRRVVDTINDLPERTRFMKGLFAWPGFRRTVLQFDRDPRLAGQTKWNTSKLVNLAVEGITSFSTKPLRLATFAGVATALGAAAMAGVVLLKTLIWGDPVAGYPSMILVVLILGSIQLLSIGLMGEYIGRLFIESKQRPLYLVDTHFTAPATHSSKAVTEKTQ